MKKLIMRSDYSAADEIDAGEEYSVIPNGNKKIPQDEVKKHQKRCAEKTCFTSFEVSAFYAEPIKSVERLDEESWQDFDNRANAAMETCRVDAIPIFSPRENVYYIFNCDSIFAPDPKEYVFYKKWNSNEEGMIIMESWLDAEVDYFVVARDKMEDAIIKEFQRRIADAIPDGNNIIDIKLHNAIPVFSVERLEGESDESLYDRADKLAESYDIWNADGWRDYPDFLIEEDEDICYVFACEDVSISDNYVYCETWRRCL